MKNKQIKNILAGAGAALVFSFLTVASVGYPDKESDRQFIKSKKLTALRYDGHDVLGHGGRWLVRDPADSLNKEFQIVVKTDMLNNPVRYYVTRDIGTTSMLEALKDYDPFSIPRIGE